VTSAKLAEMAASDWLDIRTRAVFVEFTLYNANVNLYGSVIMLIEFLSTGAPVFMQEVKVFRLTSYIGPFGIIVILFQVYVMSLINTIVGSLHAVRQMQCNVRNLYQTTSYTRRSSDDQVQQPKIQLTTERNGTLNY